MSECCEKKVGRTEEKKQALINRINRIQGQLGGIKCMIEQDKYCIDILTQISAVSSAVRALSNNILTEHINTCVAEGIKNGDTEILDELTRTLNKFTK